jgi:hypothetical protein
LRGRLRTQEWDENRRKAEAIMEKKIHMKTRSDIMIKYFSDCVCPAVHDVAMKKEAWGIWKEQFIHVKFEKDEKRLKEKIRR